MAEWKWKVNGRPEVIDAGPGESVLTVLREVLGLTGAKYGCGEGSCGACTVLVGGQARRACQVSVAEVGTREIVTIEGLAREGKLHPVQEAFVAEEAFQCGFCTPGMVMGAVALLRRKPKASEAEIRAGLNGHVCRCGVYPRIVEAVRKLAQQ